MQKIAVFLASVLVFSILVGPYSGLAYHGASRGASTAVSSEKMDSADLFDISMRRNGVRIILSGDYTDSLVNSCKSTLYSALRYLHSNHISPLKRIHLVFDSQAMRGLAGGTTMKIRCVNISEKELVSVFIHELGHIVDIGLLQGSLFSGESVYVDGIMPIYNDDKSVPFYQINWSDSSKTIEDSPTRDFLSLYAKSDAFEDFAESYNYYVLHGAEFRYLTRFNRKLQAKYAFLRDNVFAGEEYGEMRYSRTSVVKRPFDVTKLDYVALNR